MAERLGAQAALSTMNRHVRKNSSMKSPSQRCSHSVWEALHHPPSNIQCCSDQDYQKQPEWHLADTTLIGS